MKLLVFDTETTGLDADGEDKVIEFGGVLYDIDSRTNLASLQFLIHSETNNALDINGISLEALSAVKGHEGIYIELLRKMIESCDYMVAHNLQFDKKFMCKLLGTLDKPGFCTIKDIVFPRTGNSKVLAHIAADHNIPIIDAHRALTDVHLVCDLLACIPPDELKEQITASQVQKYTYRALTTFSQKDLAKAEGFSWNGSFWEKRLTEKQAESITTFNTKRMD